MDLKKHIRDIPDFPKKGIVFKDITTLLKVPAAFKYAIDQLYEKYKDEKIGKIVSIEARGYILGGVLAYKLNCGFIPARKPGKLPADTVALEYTLEYGSNRIEIHKDAVKPGERILIVDDLLATGGTALATAQLVEQLGGVVVACAFLINLTFLKGTKKLVPRPVFSIMQY